MQKVKFTNSIGQSFEFSNDYPYYLESLEGLFGDTKANIQSVTTIFQPGAQVVNSTLDVKNVSIIGSVYSVDLANISNLRSRISQVFNPSLGEGTLEYIFNGQIRKINAISESLPQFPTGEDNRHSNYQRVLINLLCPDPFLKDETQTKTEIALWNGMFSFPLKIDSVEGVKLGQRSPSLIVNVENKGHEPTGMIIKFRALATVVNPSLIDVNTQKWLKLNYTMTSGEVITINTNAKRKRIESNKNGVISQISNRLAYGSTFLQLAVGDNLLRYDASENLDLLEVDIYHDNKYVGV